MTEGRPFAWEASYPPGARWDAPLPTSTLPALLDRAVAAYGDHPAIEFRGRRIGFAELGARVERIAAGLRALGVRPGDSVALLLPNTPWHPVAFFAALRAGARVVHLTPLDPPRALARKLADADARVLVTTDLAPMLGYAAGLLADGHVQRLLVGEDAEWGGEGGQGVPPAAAGLAGLDGPRGNWPALDENDVALLQYTGGTTGAPRAAMLTHANLTATVSIYDAWNAGIGRSFRPGDRIMCVLPLFHIYALTAVLLRALSNGTELLLRQRFDAETAIRDVEAGCTHLFGVPTMWIAVVNHPGVERRSLSALRVASSGGAALPTEVGERFHQLTGLRLGGGWGMTETSPAGTNLLPDRPQAPGGIGVPLPGVELDIASLDDPARPLPPGEVGELRIRGPNVTPGYWKRPEETAAAFVDGWFLTGDIGFMAPDGQFTLVDRKKDMLISGGFNVYPRAIEDAIHEHPDVLEAAVIGVPDPYRGQAAKAFVSLRPGAAPLTLDALRAFLADRLGRHELPAALEVRDALPHTPVGKLAKRDLVEGL